MAAVGSLEDQSYLYPAARNLAKIMEGGGLQNVLAYPLNRGLHSTLGAGYP